MVDGLVNNKIGYIIQARMQSTRLPGKVLLPLPFDQGKPILLHIVEALRRSEVSGTTVVASSVNEENDVLFDFCSKERITCFRGDEEDVHSRFLQICASYEFDHVVRLTGDNPIVDTTSLERVIRYHIAEGHDYTYTRGLPIGMNFEIVKATALLDTRNLELSAAEKEHVTLVFRRVARYQCGVLDLECPPFLKEVRLTVDYESDYLFMAALYGYALNHDLPLDLKLLQKVYEEYNWLFEATKHNLQKQQYNSVTDEIGQAIRLLTRLDMQQAVRILKDHKL